MVIEEIRNQNLVLTDEEINILKNEYRRSTAFGAVKLADDEENPKVTFNVFNIKDFRNIALYFSGIFRSSETEEQLLRLALKGCLREIEVFEEAYEKENSLYWRDQIALEISELYRLLGYMLLEPSKDKDLLDYEVGFSILPYSIVAKRCNLVSNNKEAEKYLLKALMYSPSSVEIYYVLGCFYLFNCKKEETIVLTRASDYFNRTRQAYYYIKKKNRLFDEYSSEIINYEWINYCGSLLYDNKYYEEAFDMFMYAYEVDKEQNKLKDRHSAYCYNLALFYLNQSKIKYLTNTLRTKYKKQGYKYLMELRKIVVAKGIKFEEYIKDKENDPDGILKEYL